MDEDKLNELYQEYWTIHGKMLADGAKPLAIAGVLMAQAMTMYKTVLNEKDFINMMDTVLFKYRKDVKPLDLPTLQ